MNIQNPLIERYVHRSHRFVQRQRRPGMIQPTTRVHHIPVKCRRDLSHLAIIHYPHCPYHRSESEDLHCRCEVDHLVRTLFVSDSRAACRQIREFGVLQLASDHPLDRKVTVVQRERQLEWVFRIQEAVSRKVNPFVPFELFDDDPRNVLPSMLLKIAWPEMCWPILSSSTYTEGRSSSPAASA